MNMDLIDKLQSIIQEQYNQPTTVELTRPEPQFGDWSTNAALRLAKQVGQNPREVAQNIVNKLQAQLGDGYQFEVAGPGFVNIRIPDQQHVANLMQALEKANDYGNNQKLTGKTAIIEGTDPNPFKQLHIGHAYSNTIGEAVSGLHEAAGARVIRANYQGDIGMHVAKSIWGLQQLLDGNALDSVPENDRAALLGKAYALGASEFKDNESAAAEMKEINRQIYHNDPAAMELYNTGRKWSLDYFETQYERLQTRFDVYYFESVTGPEGMKIIEANRDVFAQSDGAIVYEGEQDGLHTRVFVNSQGFPTYEAKELGLAAMKASDYDADISITFTGNEIVEYFKVIKAVLAKINPEAAAKMTHLAHGMVKLPEGKMSSRTGDVITAERLLNSTHELIAEQSPESPSHQDNTLGAIKYAFLKHRIGGDIVFDINESISLEGNSGPYIQYAHARASRVVEKLGSISQDQQPDLTDDERLIVRQISQFPEVVERALDELSPQQVCTYLYELAQNFNRFYEHNRVIDDDRQAVRGQIVKAVQTVLANGLKILNIPAPSKM